MKPIRIFETHAHYDDKAFDEDRDELLRSLRAEGFDYVINVAADLRGVDATLELTREYDHVYGAIGVHPEMVYELNENTFQHVREVAMKDKMLAVGEIGLDYHGDEVDKGLQKEWFYRQLELAKELNKPVVIHSRDACEDTMTVLGSKEARGIRGVMHCYSYTVETARELLKMGYYFGIGGVITFNNAKKLVEAVEEIPMERILLETDCPYLAPTPHRGKRNSSLYIPLIAEKIAQIKGLPYYKVLEKSHENAKNLFLKGKN